MAYGMPVPAAADSSSSASETEQHNNGLSSGEELERDEFGFNLPSAGVPLGASARAYTQLFAPKAERRRLRFEARRKRLPAEGQWGAAPKRALKALLRKGLPPEHRSEVWWAVLGCEERRRSSPSTYEADLASELPSRTKDEIDRDLHRTFPNHETFRAESGRNQLKRVLLAFASHSPRVRYCQGLNYIAALFILVFSTEERAFWALVCAIERLGVEGYYVEGMLLLRADMEVLRVILAQKCPRVARRFAEQEVDLMSICSEWHLTWFAKSLPPTTVMRVWDALFYEGYKVLFRVSLGVYIQAEREVMQCSSFEDIMERAKGWPALMVQHNELMKASFAGVPRFSRLYLQQHRDAAVSKVESEDEFHRQRIAANKERAAAAKNLAKAAAPPQGVGTVRQM